MANFGDQLRAAPEEAARQREIEQEAQRQAARTAFEQEQRRIIDSAIAIFQQHAMEAAKAGKRSVDCRPNSSDIARHSAIYVGYLLTDILMCKRRRLQQAQDLVPKIEIELSTMGLLSYRVSPIEVTCRSGYNTNHYIAFRITASW